MSLQDSSTDNLRKSFLDFFKTRGHEVAPSSSLIPKDDPTVLFTTAGMQQFKRFYLFPEEAPMACVATCQKCLRTGDIEEVGDETHLTFFEMLGNFSFGYPEKEHSYFKQEAIKMAWEFLTGELKVEKERISATYFAGDRGIKADKESRDLLKEITGLDSSKILGTDFSETFWSLGTEGSPGGPTVEFYIDGIEIWNLVFNEYKFTSGEYVKSESAGVDTGMGLERLVAVMQGESDIYQTDAFASAIKKIEELSGKKYTENKKEFRIIADHLRAATALINDGVTPSNKDRGYVLRKLIRRAIVKGKQIGIEKNFLVHLSGTDDVKKKLEKEESKFRSSLLTGLKMFEKRIFGGFGSTVFGGSTQGKNVGPSLSGQELFDLYQTYGFPIELSSEIAKEKNISIDNIAIEQFNNLVREHQEKSRTASAGMFKGGLSDNKAETTHLHTAAHLLLAGLRQILGPDINQKGSNITEERLRFDFNYPEKLTPEQILEVENFVNEKIKEDLPVTMEEMSVDEAKKTGATGVFDDRYGDKVKVYNIGSQDAVVSREICGGPHVERVGELGHFKIIKEQSSSAGIRRIKAVLS